MDQHRFSALVIFIGASIGAFSVSLAACALSRKNSRILTYVPPAAKCFVSGLLSGLGLLVMLPSALSDLPPGYSVEGVLRLFCIAPIAMFFMHHVLLNHQHTQHSHQKIASNSSSIELGCVCDAPPAFAVFQMPRYCPAIGPPKPEPTSMNCSEVISVVLRALPYTIHAFIDGAMLGTAHSVMVLLSLALPVALCAVQDVGTIMINFGATGATRKVTFITNVCFASGFPLGAAFTVALTSLCRTQAGPGVVLVPLRAFAGGVFVYMALFELAPPHVHGRLPNLRYMCAFAAGMALILLSEEAESWAVGTIFAAETDEIVSRSNGAWKPDNVSMHFLSNITLSHE